MVMMLKLIPLTALALGLSSGAALADRQFDHRGAVEHREAPRSTIVHERGGGNWHNGAIIAHDHDHDRGRGWNGGWNGGGRVVVRGGYDGSYRNNYYYYARRPIYVGRPVIRERYYDRYRRPSLIVENYGPRDGYYWVRGGWTWDGVEWIWQPGHYQPVY